MSDPRVSFLGDVADGEVNELLALLESTTVLIRVGGEAVRTVAGQALTFQLATLTVRLFDRVVLDGDVEQPSLIRPVDGAFLPGLAEMLPSLRPLTPRSETRSVAVGIGADSGVAEFHLGSSAWGAYISLENPQPVADTPNTLGALAAGTLGAGEVFKSVLGSRIDAVVRSSYSLSLLDYAADGASDAQLPEVTRLDATMFGCGSIGLGFLQAVSLFAPIEGGLVLADNGVLETKNAYKYPLLDWEGARTGAKKVDWAAERLKWLTPRLEAVKFDGTAQDYVSSLPADYRIPVAISAVDTMEARVEIQDTLPEFIVNAGITGTTAEVSCHKFGDGACLACLSLDEALESWDPYALASRTGLDPGRVYELVRGNLGMARSDIDSMTKARVLDPGTIAVLPEYLGQPLLSLWNRVAYGEAEVATTSGRPARVTTAFVSAFAGVLLLAETVKRSSPGLRGFQVDNSYQQELMGIPANGQFRHPRDSRGWCLCRSGFRNRVYRRKYNQPEEPEDYG